MENTLAKLKADPEGLAREAAAQIGAISLQAPHQVAVVFGTGWAPAVEQLGPAVWKRQYSDLPGFFAPTVEGHPGQLQSLQIGKQNVLAFIGRSHRYEFDVGEDMEPIVHGVRVARLAGCSTIILTNAVGGLRPDMRVGDAVLISDHNDLITTAPSPLRGPRFLDCAAVYDPMLREMCRDVDPDIREGVYAQVRGPHFESPAAIDFLRRNGIDLVGMSIIQEAIMAHYLAMHVLGISLVTDVPGDTITHEKVQGVVNARAPALGQFLRQIIERL